MRIIDAHAHLFNEPDYLKKLIETMDECGIEKCCLSGIGSLLGFLDDDDVKDAIQEYPDRIIAAVYIRPGVDSPDKITRYHEQGFKMVKVILPKSGYDNPDFFELWAAAQELKMPILFHTGIVTCKDSPGENISSWNMHPMRLEPVTREFPDLKLIIAHMGIHWNTEAAELARMRPNVYMDLTGKPGGYRARIDTEGLDKYLWWPGAFEKIVFGTDVHCSKINQILNEDKTRLNNLGIDMATQKKIFAENMINLLNME